MYSSSFMCHTGQLGSDNNTSCSEHSLGSYRHHGFPSWRGSLSQYSQSCCPWRTQQRFAIIRPKGPRLPIRTSATAVTSELSKGDRIAHLETTIHDHHKALHTASLRIAEHDQALAKLAKDNREIWWNLLRIAVGLWGLLALIAWHEYRETWVRYGRVCTRRWRDREERWRRWRERGEEWLARYESVWV